jgi:hypothetical protein
LLKQRHGDERAKELLRTDYPLMGGSKMEHKFDVTIANRNPFFSAHGISFEIQTPEQTVGSLAFMIIDVKASKPNFPLAVVALPPKPESLERERLEAIYQQTINTYEKYGASVLQEDQVESWVSESSPLMNRSFHSQSDLRLKQVPYLMQYSANYLYE